MARGTEYYITLYQLSLMDRAELVRASCKREMVLTEGMA